ncbi:MAG: PD40 domain-containing protein, partial [Steroidobacter sp.]
MFDLRIESRRILATLGCLLSAITAVAAQAPESSEDAAFDLTEGTWMSLDVSPDGRTIVFDLLGDIYSIPAAGGDATLLHGGSAMQRIPSFSADGRRLIYMSDASGTDNVWVSDADGSSARQVTHEQEDILMSAAWGPRDESVGVIKVRATFAHRNTSEMWLYDLAGGRGRVLVESPPSGRDIEEPSFALDGRFVYYTERLTAPLVYVDANQINYAISRRDLATGRSEQIVGGFGSATSAQISPDGQRLAFIRRVQEKTVLFVYDLQSGAQYPVYAELDRDLHASYSPQATYYPRFDWFPDGLDLAIWSRGKLWRVNTNSTAIQEIPFRARSVHRIERTLRFEHELAPKRFDVRIVRQMAPSPDGRHITVAAVGHLWRKQLPAGLPRRLTQAAAFEFDPAYSMDGRWLVYVEWDDERGSSLKIISAHGGRARTVLNSSGLIREPTFSPDGKSLAYRISSGDKAIGGFRIKPGLYRVAAAGGEGRFLVAANEAPQFSANGERIYFAASYPTSEGVSRRLQSVNLDGLDLRDHARTVDADTTELRISPDQRWISFRR